MSHNIEITLSRGDGVEYRLVCHEPATAPCRNVDENCHLVTDFDVDPTAVMEDYTGEKVTILDLPVFIAGVDEFTFEWEFATESNS